MNKLVKLINKILYLFFESKNYKFINIKIFSNSKISYV